MTSHGDGNRHDEHAHADGEHDHDAHAHDARAAHEHERDGDDGHGHGGHGAHGGHGGHGHGGHGGHGAAASAALAPAVVLTTLFMLVEASVGFWTNSLALVADAGHMLADAGALSLALFAQRVAARPRTERSTYGYRRAEVLAAFANGMVLAGVSVLILKEASERYFSPRDIRGDAMLGTAVTGLVVNLLVAALLMRGQKDSINVRAAFAHVLSDALGSVAAILAGVAVVTVGWTRADPLLAVCIACIVAWSGFRVLKETASILLESAPPHVDVAGVERTIRETQGVADVHDLHVWRISEKFDSLTAHVILARGEHGTEVARRVADCLRDRHGLTHVTIQPEAPPPDAVVTVRSSRDGRPLGRTG